VEGCKADIVMTDNRLIARQATRYLIEKGHRDILHFTSNLSNSTVHDRLEGFREELACSGLPFSKENVFCSDIDQEKCYENTVKLFGTSPRPPFTAIYTYNDLMAFPVIRALTDSGLRVPQDVAVIGNDNISFCEDCLVPLTTIAQDNYEIGKSAAALLIEKLSGGPAPSARCCSSPVGLLSENRVNCGLIKGTRSRCARLKMYTELKNT
jgi:DNA-binding LacI/PurR family transcriptional regulator